MAIDTSGKWWTGTEPEDLAAYLKAFSAKTYRVGEFRLSRCTCGSTAFRLEADDEEGVACRTCVTCGVRAFIADSDEFWEEAQPETWSCVECECEAANVGIGFSMYEEGVGIRWLYVGARCTKCGVLGCFTGWKVGSDDLSIMDRC